MEGHQRRERTLLVGEGKTSWRFGDRIAPGKAAAPSATAQWQGYRVYAREAVLHDVKNLGTSTARLESQLGHLLMKP